jgi:hypothetical protein
MNILTPSDIILIAIIVIAVCTMIEKDFKNKYSYGSNKRYKHNLLVFNGLKTLHWTSNTNYS